MRLSSLAFEEKQDMDSKPLQPFVPDCMGPSCLSELSWLWPRCLTQWSSALHLEVPLPRWASLGREDRAVWCVLHSAPAVDSLRRGRPPPDPGARGHAQYNSKWAERGPVLEKKADLHSKQFRLVLSQHYKPQDTQAGGCS